MLRGPSRLDPGAGRVKLALRGPHSNLRVAGHWWLFWLWLLRSHCTLRCLEVLSITRCIRGLWHCLGIRPRLSSGLFIFLGITFALSRADLSPHLLRRSVRDPVFRECSTDEVFAKGRKEKSLPVPPRHNCVLSKCEDGVTRR